MSQKRIYSGTFIHTPRLGALEALEDTYVGVDERGVIIWIGRDVEAGWEGVEVEGMGGKGGERWWFPGFVVSPSSPLTKIPPKQTDTHTHASQYPNAGLFGTSTLLSWLHTYTFPLESRFASPSFATRIYTRAVSTSLAHGTTTAAYYATIHAESTARLADTCRKRGQRAFVGRVSMDVKMEGESYADASVSDAIKAEEAVMEHIRSTNEDDELVQPILTPRFAPACSGALLRALGDLRTRNPTPLRIQTHISESPSECALVRSLFPDRKSYADVYDRYGLLTAHTVLAHGIHLSPEEVALIRERGAGVSHCPLSNTSLGSGICPVRRLLDGGVKVGLGTDVSGGAGLSVLGAAREAAGVSRLLGSSSFFQGDGGEEERERERCKLGVAECLFLATKGGAEVLGLGGKVGGFEVGMEWDAQLVRVEAVGEEEGWSDGEEEGGSDGEEVVEGEGGAGTKGGGRIGFEDKGPVQCWGGETWEEKVAKWMYCGDDRNTIKVWVRGRLVHER
ncbi:MAG: hypothetical protein Q9219_005394 [cf. Caloplaca sp. 3 TL-2023]